MKPKPSGHSVAMALGLCVISAGIATATTLMLGASSPAFAPPPTGAAEQVRAPGTAQLSQDVATLRQVLSELAARVAGMTSSEPVGADRTPADSSALARDIAALGKRLASIEREVAALKDGADPRTNVVASRRRTARADTKDLQQRVENRKQRHELDSHQAERMLELELKWKERDKVILSMWESGASLATLSRAIEQDDEAYRAEALAILTAQQREPRVTENAIYPRASFTR